MERHTACEVTIRNTCRRCSETFGSFETAFPKVRILQAFRYQIVQAYGSHKDWSNARTWLQKIIEKGAGEDTFYTEAAKARLQKVEY